MLRHLKTEEAKLDGVGLVTLCELSAAAMVEVMESQREGTPFDAAILVVKHGVVEWQDESVEEIARNVPMAVVNALVERIYTLSGVDAAKKSEPALSVASSSGSR